VPIDELIMLFSIMLGEDAADWLRRKAKKPQREKQSKKKRGS
jgi:hypothetical protein